METITIVKDKNYHQHKSTHSKFITIQLPEINIEKFESVIAEIRSELGQGIFEQPGVYFLEEEDGFYIGETTSLVNRIATHLNNKKIKSITFSTTKSASEIMEKTEVADIESILIQTAKDCGFKLENTLKNKLDEKRKTLNNTTHKQNNEFAKQIWECFLMFNADGILRYFANGGGVKGPYSNHAPRGKTELNFVQNETKAQTIRPSRRTKEVDMSKAPKPDESEEIFKFTTVKPSNKYGFGIAEIFTIDVMKEVMFDYMVN